MSKWWMRIPNPFDDDSRFDGAREKWGGPSLIEPVGKSGRYWCRMCGATWTGEIDDYCKWCHMRWKTSRELKRNKLLYPEWLNWRDRYFALGDADAEVWRATRGFHGDYLDVWQTKLMQAVENSLVTEVEAVAAINRAERWMTNLEQSGGS
jgi:hypothetical protein